MKAILWRCVVAAALGVSATPAIAAEREVLPDDVAPVHYDLAISPDRTARAFRGTAAITIAVARQVNEITLNAVDLVFEKATVDGGASGTTRYDAKLGRATIQFAKPIGTGTHKITIAYRGKLNRETTGMFVMDYDTPSGRKSVIGTNLEPAYARKIFPGWDEPARKATFRVSVDAPKGEMAISNMPVASTVSVSPTTNRVTFATTPKMSTYLFYLGIGDFERIHKQVDGVDVGVVVKRGDTAKGAYALDEAARLLHWYNDYFGSAYPLPKLDLIAAPGALDGGSMENWGAIFYSQEHLLFDPAASTEADRQEVFRVVAHEMAHQWFGDLVTMAWWDNLWLNEGFARWMQTYAADALHPEWQTGLKAQTIFERGKVTDALPWTHPMVQTIDTLNQAEDSFDSITYDKGAAVITMLNAYVGEQGFRAGIRRYMAAHAYANTVDGDLWKLIQQASAKPILEVARDFTTQEGVPLIRVSRTSTGLHLAQDRFFASGKPVAGDDRKWRMPLTIGPIGGAGAAIVLAGERDVPTPDVAIVNAGQTSYTRVLYAQPVFDALLAKVPSMPSVDQLGLINDAAQFGAAGYAPASNLLALLTNIPAAADPIVWERVVAMLENVDYFYRGTPGRAAFRRYAVGILRPALARFGTSPSPSESSNVPIVRAALVEALGSLGDPEIVFSAQTLISNGGGTVAEQRSALAIAAAKADPALFDLLLVRARAARDPLDKLHLYSALAGVEDPTLARRMVDIALSREVPAGSTMKLLEPISEAHPDVAWEVAVPRIGAPEAGISESEQRKTVFGIAASSGKLGRIGELQAYAAQHIPEDARAPIRGVIASIEQNHRVATQMLPELDQWIATHTSK